MLTPQEFLANPIIKGLVTQAQKQTPFGLSVIEALENEDWPALSKLAEEYNDFVTSCLMNNKEQTFDRAYKRLRGEA